MSIAHSPLLSAVVLNYRSPKDTVRCVRALMSQTIADRMHIIVIDNHSEDESIAFIRAQLKHEPSVRIIETRENVGYGRGNNMGATWAAGEYLLIINPDNTLESDAAERMIAYLNHHPHTGVVGPALVHDDGTIRASARSFPSLFDLFMKRLFPLQWAKRFEASRKSRESEHAIRVDWLVGACLMMRTETFRAIGGFDPRFFLFFEDIDLCRTLGKRGMEVVYLPDIHVRDRKERLSGGTILSLLSRKTTRIHVTSAAKYFWKWAGRS